MSFFFKFYQENRAVIWLGGAALLSWAFAFDNDRDLHAITGGLVVLALVIDSDRNRKNSTPSEKEPTS